MHSFICIFCFAFVGDRLGSGTFATGCGNTSALLCSPTSVLIKQDFFTACIMPISSMSFSFKPFDSVLLIAVSISHAFIDPLFLGTAGFSYILLCSSRCSVPSGYNLDVGPKNDCSHLTFHFLFRYYKLLSLRPEFVLVLRWYYQFFSHSETLIHGETQT